MDQLKAAMHSAFEAELPHRLRRASRVTLQPYAPAEWFTALATECAELYVAGHFYGAIGISRAYINAVANFLGDLYNLRGHWSAEGRFRRLNGDGTISCAALDAVLNVINGMGFDKLNREHAHEYQRLAARADECLRDVATVESEVFAYALDGERVTPRMPNHWSAGIMLRQLW